MRKRKRKQRVTSLFWVFVIAAILILDNAEKPENHLRPVPAARLKPKIKKIKLRARKAIVREREPDVKADSELDFVFESERADVVGFLNREIKAQRAVASDIKIGYVKPNQRRLKKSGHSMDALQVTLVKKRRIKY